MIKSRLANLPLESLVRIARKLDNEYVREHTPSREQLIDLILDVLNDDPDFDDDSNAIRIEETKFNIIQEIQVSANENDDYSLPEAYNETRIVLMLRDPSWAFAYWEICASKRNELQNNSFFQGLYLRVFELHYPEVEDKSKIRDSFLIPVTTEDNRWYINLPKQDTVYRLDLVAGGKAHDEVLAGSNSIRVPKTNIRYSLDEEDESREILFLSKVLRVRKEERSDAIPQRIIAYLDDTNF